MYLDPFLISVDATNSTDAMTLKRVKVDSLPTCLSRLYKFLKQGYCPLMAVLANFANSFRSFNNVAALRTP